VGGALARIDPEASSASTPGSASPEAATSGPARAVASPSEIAGEEASPAGKAGATSQATPVARRLADERDLPIEAIEGSGSDGRVTKRDVLRHADAGSPPAPAPAPQPPAARKTPPARAGGAYTPVPGDRVIPMSPMRRIIAEHMVYSKHTSPHVGTVAEVDMSAIVALRTAHKVAFEEANGFGLTFLPFIVHAVVRALKEFPALNASVLEGAIVEKKHVNLGLAVETEKGLVVPVVRDADRFSLAGLAAEIDDLARRARNKKLSADDLQGGTFTVSNPGRQGNLYGFAIINQPQVGIVRMGEMIKRPVVRTISGEDAIVIRPMMHVALSYDHRAVDGSPANGFLYRIRELLERADCDL